MQPPASRPPFTLAALVVALYWAIESTDVNDPQVERVAILVTAIVLGWIALRGSPFAAALTSYLAVLVAASERLRREPLHDGSDVLRATSEAIGIAAGGGNPYGTCLQSTVPPCSPFVYPPGELAWYAVPQTLFGDISRVDTWAGVLIVVAIAVAGIRLGFESVVLPAMLYASWGTAGFRAVDGQNDVSASALVVFACVALAFATPRGPEGAWRHRLFIASAVLLGWAIAFKQFAVLVLPPVARWLGTSGASWRRYSAIALGVAAAFVLPFFVRDPLAFINTQFAAIAFHDEIWGTNLLHMLQRFGDPSGLVPLFTAIELFGTSALVVLVAWRWRTPSLGAAILVGAGLVLVPLLFAKWTTQPYYAYVGAIAACGLALLDARADVSARAPGSEAPSRPGSAAPSALARRS